MTQSKALSLFSGKNVPEDVAQKNAQKLIAALNVLGDKYVLAKRVTKLEQPRKY